MNPECQAKHVKSFALFVSRDALNIEGLSEATLEKFISRGYIHTFADIFHLDQYKEKIQKMEGFGEKSYKKLTESIEKARTTTLPRVIYSLGIAGIGLANAKVICRELKYDVESLLKVSVAMYLYLVTFMPAASAVAALSPTALRCRPVRVCLRK